MAFWSIFALLSADDSRRDTDALYWIRQNIIAAVGGALIDAYNADSTDAHIEVLVRLDGNAQTGQPWARNAGREGRPHLHTCLSYHPNSRTTPPPSIWAGR